MSFRFQNLEIYQLAKEIVKYNYYLTKQFPDDEKYALVQQMNRAAISVPSNIAEGVSRNTVKDKSHFINISYSSLMELVCQSEIACELGFISEKDYSTMVAMSKNLSVKLSNFVTSIQKQS
ncbi:MAG: four helix bundle protein [Kiritimatiellae bacterium]|jgi:four helix bundle protein|nr:four helix bundle protein [Kiritimatiellia bacterium]